MATLAGGFLGDGGSATSAAFAQPTDVAVAANGDVYVADRWNHRIRRFTPGGSITTFAGNGTTAMTGDGGPAASAGLNSPAAIAFDAGGNLYIADSAHHRVRKVTPGGVISTVAGTGTAGSAGDGGLATLAQLNDPEGLAVDAGGNVYVAEFAGHRVRKFSVGGTIGTIAGTGVASFSGDGGPGTAATLNRPVALAFNPAGDLFIADAQNNRIRKLSAGTITTYAGNGGTAFCQAGVNATTTSLLFPSGIAFDAAGTLYISDSYDILLAVSGAGAVTGVGGICETGYTGDGYASLNRIFSPGGLDVDASGAIVFADVGNNLVRRVDLSGNTLSTLAGRMDAVDNVPAVPALLGETTDVAYGPTGDLYIADAGRARVRRVAGDGKITTVAGNGRFDSDGDGGSAVAASIAQPTGVAFLPSGDLLVADRVYGVVRRVHLGLITTVAGGGASSAEGATATQASLSGLTALVAGDDGAVYVAVRNKVKRFYVGGVVTTVAGTGAGSGTAGYNGDGISPTSAQLNGPQGLGLDSTGALYIADTKNHRVRKVAGGIISTVAGNGVAGSAVDGGPATSANLSSPQDVLADADGRLYISDSGNGRIRAVAIDGTIASVAGTGTNGFNVESGAATSVQLASPRGIALRPDGLLAIADRNNQRARGVQLAPAQVVVLPSLSIADATVTEGDSGAKLLAFVVSLTKPSDVDVSFQASTDAGTASPGSDFVELPPTAFTIPHGELSATINVTVNGDTDVEGHETLAVNLNAATGANIAKPQALGRISNDDRPILWVEGITVVEGAVGQPRTAQVVVRLSAPSTGYVAMFIRTEYRLSATSDDYVSRSDELLLIDPGRTTQVFNVTILGDDLPEATESFAVVARGFDGSFVPGNLEGTVTILDDDGASATTTQTDARAALAPRPRVGSRRGSRGPGWRSWTGAWRDE